MAIDKTIKSNRLLQSRRYTVASLTDAQEAFTSVLDINSKEVYAQSNLLPTSSLPFSGSSQNGNTYAVGGQNLLKYWYQHTLTPSNVVSASLVDAWFFIDPSGSSVTPQIIQAGQQTNFISNKYDDPSLTNADAQDNPPGYNVVVLVDNVKQNPSNYQFDYKDGVLQFNTSAPSSAQVVKITAYQYVGQTVDTVLTNLSASISSVSSSVSNLSSNKITTSTVTASVASGSTSFLLESSSVNLFSVSNTGIISGSTLTVSSITASNVLVTNTITASSITATSASFGYVETISGSAVIIGEEFIILNTQIPSARYAGLQIYDSGSNATASVVWDSQTNHFVYENVSGSTYSGGGFLAGPKNTGSLSDITYPTQYRVLRSQGDDHVYNSNIIDNDIKVSIGINTEVTGALYVSNGITGSLLGTASYATQALSSSYALNSTSASYALNSTSASYALNSTSASYALNSTSASYALNSTSASYALNSTSASYAESSSYTEQATSASYAQTASYINPLNQNVIITGSTFIKGTDNGSLYIDSNLIPISTFNGTQIITFNAGLNIYTDNTDIEIYYSGESGSAHTELSPSTYNSASGNVYNDFNIITNNGITLSSGSVSTYTVWVNVKTSPETWWSKSGLSLGTIQAGINIPLSGDTNTTLGTSGGDLFNAGFTSGSNPIPYANTFRYQVPNPISFIGNTRITGSLNVTAGITGSLLGTASFASTASFITSSNVFGPYGSNSVLSSSYAVSSSMAATASYVPASAVVGLNLDRIATGSISASVFINSPTAFSVVSGSTTLLSINTASVVTTTNLVVTNDLTVAGTASFTNVDNLSIRDKFILINSGSSTLADSGIISQYNTAGSGSSFYLDADSTGTYGRWAVAYDVIGTVSIVTPDEFVVTAKKASGTPPATPTWGGTTNGFGNIYVNSDNGEIYIYS